MAITPLTLTVALVDRSCAVVSARSPVADDRAVCVAWVAAEVCGYAVWRPDGTLRAVRALPDGRKAVRPGRRVILEFAPEDDRA